MKTYPELMHELRESLETLFIDYQDGDKDYDFCYINQALSDRLYAEMHEYDKRRQRCSDWYAERRIMLEHRKIDLKANLRDRTRRNKVRNKELIANHKILGKLVSEYLKDRESQPKLNAAYKKANELNLSVRLGNTLTDIGILNIQNGKVGESWKGTPWDSEEWAMGDYYWVHAAHISESDAGLVAFNLSNDKMRRNIQTKMKPGRYLQRFYGHVLSDEDIKYWSSKFSALAEGPVLHFIDNDTWAGSTSELEDAWINIYRRGPHSCMKGKDAVRVYAMKGNHLALAYWEFEGSIVGRCIVRNDEREWIRCYSDSGVISIETLEQRITNAGYKESRNLEGIRVQKIEYNPGWVMPYLDGRAQMVEDQGSYFVITDNGEYECCNTSGYIEGLSCSCCGGACYEDELTYVEAADGSVCSGCLDERYTYAHGRYGQEWYSNDDVVYCRTDGEYYVERWASHNDVYQCEQCGDWYHIDDLVPVQDAESICCNCAVALDEDDDYGNSYAHPDYVQELSDGRVVHTDDYDRLQAEIDAEGAENEGEDDDGARFKIVRPAEDTSPNLTLGLHVTPDGKSPGQVPAHPNWPFPTTSNPTESERPQA